MLKRVFSTANKHYDLAVIGGGPGGYVGAIKAAQLGLKTVCIEKRGALGGTCLNVGCIPSKTLLNISHKYHEMLHADNFGLHCEKPTYNWSEILNKKEGVIKGLTGGIEYLFKKNKVDYVKGWGSFQDQNNIIVKGQDGKEEVINAKNIMIATGSEPKILPGFKFDEKIFVSSTGALALKEVPKHLIIIGAGVIGLELGSVYRRMGAEVTVIEFADRVCPTLDTDIGKEFQKALKKDGIKFMFHKKSLKGEIDPTTNEAIVDVEDIKTGQKEQIRGDVCLISTGRRPFTDNLGLEKLKIPVDNLGRVIINERFQTNYENIYAIGDVVEGPMLAHKAEEEGIAVAEYLSGHDIHLNYNAIPGVIYTNPEIAFVGKTEQQLIAEKVEYKVGLFPLSANSRARANLEIYNGLVKILADKKTDRILGAHIMSPNAGDLIHELVIAIEYGASSEDIARTSHAHPSISEAIREASLAAYSKAIHV
jgi:dihydrolipoamide dehydrogenase